MFNDFLKDLKESFEYLRDDVQDMKDDIRDDMNDLKDELQDKKMRSFVDLASEVGLPVKNKYPQHKTTVVFNSSDGVSKITVNSNRNFKIQFPLGQLVFLVILFIVRILLAFNRDNIIINLSIKSFNILVFLVTFLIGFTVVRLFSKLLKGKFLNSKNKKLNKPEKQVSLSVKRDISKEDLMSKLSDLLNNWEDADGEEGMSYPYIQRAKKQLEKLDNIYTALSLLVDNNEESSLSEVFNVIKATEEQIVKNIVSMINHIKVELSIDGYDRTNIESYLNDNDILIQECSKLLKASLLYMDGKAGASGIQEYIESMVETLNKLKKEK